MKKTVRLKGTPQVFYSFKPLKKAVSSLENMAFLSAAVSNI